MHGSGSSNASSASSTSSTSSTSTASTAVEIDRRALFLAQKRAAKRRPAVSAAARLQRRLSFQRLGYRTQSDYAREDLGTSARSLRRLACLGRRLATLPKTRAAYEGGGLALTKAECIARVARPDTEGDWLKLAESLPIRQLRAVVRGTATVDATDRADTNVAPRATDATDTIDAIARTGATATTAATVATAATAATATTATTATTAAAAATATTAAALATAATAASDTTDSIAEAPAAAAVAPEDCDEQRSVLEVPVPGWMVGKVAAGLRLVGKVAGAPLPEGTRWEFIAAEYLSGALPDAGGSVPGALLENVATRQDGEGDTNGPNRSNGPNGYETVKATAPADPEARDTKASSGPENGASVASPSGPALSPDGRAIGRDPVSTEEPLDVSPAGLTPWELHDVLKDAYLPAGATDLELGILLRKIRKDAVWKILGFVHYDDYIRDRLGLSPRTARRLVRLGCAGRRHPALRKALSLGDLSVLKANVVGRVLDLRLSSGAAEAWIEYARRMSMARLEDAASWAVSRVAVDPEWVRRDGRPPHPSFRFDGGLERRRGSRRRPGLAASATSCIRLWLTEGEREVLNRAVSVVRRARGPDWPLWAMLDELLDHFVDCYEDPSYRRLSAQSPTLLRDDWQCQAPGCRARSGLHVHHILARGVGGPNTLDNLVVLCDFHHLSIHRGWIGCCGKAPDRIRWSFGVQHRSLWHSDMSYSPRYEAKADWRRVPIARFVGQYRLSPDEPFATVELRLFGAVTRARGRFRNLLGDERSTRRDRHGDRSSAA